MLALQSIIFIFYLTAVVNVSPSQDKEETNLKAMTRKTVIQGTNNFLTDIDE
jgi:hypothetical protein